jgi:hypothetical protein
MLIQLHFTCLATYPFVDDSTNLESHCACLVVVGVRLCPVLQAYMEGAKARGVPVKSPLTNEVRRKASYVELIFCTFGN